MTTLLAVVLSLVFGLVGGLAFALGGGRGLFFYVTAWAIGMAQVIVEMAGTAP